MTSVSNMEEPTFAPVMFPPMNKSNLSDYRKIHFGMSLVELMKLRRYSLHL